MREYLVGWTLAVVVGLTSIACGGGGDDPPDPDTAPTSIRGYLLERKHVSIYLDPLEFLQVGDTSTAFLTEGYAMTAPNAITFEMVMTDIGNAAGYTQNQSLCSVQGTYTFTDVANFDPLVRQKVNAAWTTDGCNIGLAGVNKDKIVHAVKRNADGSPAALAMWVVTGTANDADPVPALSLYEGGGVDVKYVCPAGADFGDVGCTGTCYFPFTGNPYGDCPTLASLQE